MTADPSQGNAAPAARTGKPARRERTARPLLRAARYAALGALAAGLLLAGMMAFATYMTGSP